MLRIVKKITSLIILLFFILTTFLANLNVQAYASNGINILQPYGNYGNSNMGISDKDVSNLDLSNQLELVKTQTFDTHTIWPSKNKMPENFNPQKVLEWGKDPGIGIRKLHEMGYTGKGVNVAYIDQPLLISHSEYNDRNIIYTKIRPNVPGMNNASMHGPAVLSILAGKDVGVAPESTVYFFGHPAWIQDQNTHAESLRKLIEINKSLSDDKKIRIVGFSDGPDTREKNIEEYKNAIQEAENNDIMVIDVSCNLNISPLEVKYPNDKNNSQNYEVANWFKSSINEKDAFFVPTSGRTTAVGNGNDVNEYAFWTDGGLSWAIPYVVGTIALGLQIDPQLTKDEAYNFLKQSQIPYQNGGIINPEGFVKLVKQNYDLKNNASNYYFLLYNSNRISKNDKLAIEDYATRLKGDNNNYFLKDVANYSSATDIYNVLKQQSKFYKGKLKGIQIFGSSEDVPSFDIHFKVKMQSGIDDSGIFKSDLFYGNFDSDVNALINDFSIYKASEEKLNVNFVPQWSVARLPLSAGEIAPFINKYYGYKFKVKGNKIPYINFSNPIFPQQRHSDDMGYFIKERLDKEFNIIKSSDYKLYGNNEGLFPVTTNVLGGFNNINIKKENQNGIANFFINSHGQQDNIDNCIFINSKGLNKYKEKIRSSSVYKGKNDLLELRIPFLNMSNINSILSENYYTLTLWTCSNGFDLRNDNLAHEALANGKAIDVMAASSIISNNGVNNAVSLENLKKNNFYYFMYEFFKYQSEGYSRSDSFFNAKRLYATEILKHPDLLGEGNYGFNLHNVLSYHYLGVIDIPETQNTGAIELPEKDILPEINNNSDLKNSNVYISFKDNDLKYSKVEYKFSNTIKEFNVQDISTSVDTNKVYIRIKYYSPQNDYICLFLQGDAPGLKEIINDGTKKGDNILIISFNKDELKNYKAGLAINIGSRNFIFLDKTTTDNLCNKSNI
jgi:hypothetical protein